MITQSSPTTTECPLCGAPLQDSNECSRCDWVRGYGAQERVHLDSHDIAAFALSIVPGAGHIFKGHQTLGWVLLGVGVPAVFVLAFAFTMFFGWLMVPVYWVAVAVDAYFRKDLRAAAPSIGRYAGGVRRH